LSKLTHMDQGKRFDPGNGPANLDRYERIAPLYDLLDLPFEYGHYRSLRQNLFEGMNGHILDAGVGTGRNFYFYPAGATVTGIDISSAMLARAERRLCQSPASSIELCQMDVSRMAFRDYTFDAAVASFLFCVLPAALQVPALKELQRVVRPGGLIRLLEYVRPEGKVRRLISKLWEPWIAWAYGASFDRETEAHVREAGLSTFSSRFVVPDLIKLIEIRR